MKNAHLTNRSPHGSLRAVLSHPPPLPQNTILIHCPNPCLSCKIYNHTWSIFNQPTFSQSIFRPFSLSHSAHFPSAHFLLGLVFTQLIFTRIGSFSFGPFSIGSFCNFDSPIFTQPTFTQPIFIRPILTRTISLGQISLGHSNWTIF